MPTSFANVSANFAYKRPGRGEPVEENCASSNIAENCERLISRTVRRISLIFQRLSRRKYCCVFYRNPCGTLFALSVATRLPVRLRWLPPSSSLCERILRMFKEIREETLHILSHSLRDAVCAQPVEANCASSNIAEICERVISRIVRRISQMLQRMPCNEQSHAKQPVLGLPARERTGKQNPAFLSPKCNTWHARAALARDLRRRIAAAAALLDFSHRRGSHPRLEFLPSALRFLAEPAGQELSGRFLA